MTPRWCPPDPDQTLHTPPNTKHHTPAMCPPAGCGTSGSQPSAVTPWEGGAPHAGPRSPLACPRRWERPRPLPAPPAPGRRQLCRGALPKAPKPRRLSPNPAAPEAPRGAVNPPRASPATPPEPAPQNLGVPCQGGVRQRSPIPSSLGTPRVSVPPPAAGNGGAQEIPPHGQGSPRGPPPRCRGPSPAEQPLAA